MRGYFASCVVFFRAPQGRGKMPAMSKMSAMLSGKLFRNFHHWDIENSPDIENYNRYFNSISFLALPLSLIKLLLFHFHSFSLCRGHILIATPGRLEDLLFRKKDGLDLGVHVKSLVSFQVLLILALIRFQLKQWIYEWVHWGAKA